MKRPLALVIALLTPLVLFAQSSTITGSVTDDHEKPLANAAVQVANMETQVYEARRLTAGKRVQHVVQSLRRDCQQISAQLSERSVTHREQ